MISVCSRPSPAPEGPGTITGRGPKVGLTAEPGERHTMGLTPPTPHPAPDEAKRHQIESKASKYLYVELPTNHESTLEGVCATCEQE